MIIIAITIHAGGIRIEDTRSHKTFPDDIPNKTASFMRLSRPRVSDKASTRIAGMQIILTKSSSYMYMTCLRNDLYFQVISGSFPIAQLRTPLAAVEYVAQRIHVERILRLVSRSKLVNDVLEVRKIGY